jgi:transcriptional regulator with GAF, ATPase, and Fis domain
MIREEKFREDLIYHLNAIPVVVPPLRERRENIPLLVNYFVAKLLGQMGGRSSAHDGALDEPSLAMECAGTGELQCDEHT